MCFRCETDRLYLGRRIVLSFPLASSTMSIIPALILESERGATWKAQWLINLLTSTQDGGALNGEVSIVLLDEKRGAIMSSLPERLNTALGGASSTSV